MTKRRLFWLAFAACLGLAVFWGVRLLTPRHRINRESFDKIQIDMTLGEVEAILGVPAGKYVTGPSTYDFFNGDGIGFLDGDRVLDWIGDWGQIQVLLNTKNKVSAKHKWMGRLHIFLPEPPESPRPHPGSCQSVSCR